jgi:hypothetical protein
MTIFTQPAVEKYLADLDKALTHISTQHARELRQQVREHLEDALSPDATDAEVEATLTRLGPPGDLMTADPEPPARVVYTRPSIAGWLRQRPRGFWAAIVAVAAVLIAATVLVTIETHIAPMEADCHPCAYAFPEDRLHLLDPPVFDYNHMIVNQRFGQDQAMTFTLYNPSRYTQVVQGGQIGLSPAETDEPMSLDIATVSQEPRQLEQEWPRHFTTHGVAIAPKAYQQVVLHWVQNVCREPSSTSKFGGLDLQVKTLGITRMESVTIGEEFDIITPGGRGRCKMGARGHGVFRTRF